MADLTDIKRRIYELAPAQFQELCDTLLSKMGYMAVHGYGMKAGTGNTTIGNPDTYFRNKDGKYVMVAYTIQQANIYSKIKEDIEKCLDPTKTGLEVKNIAEVICCHTSSNLNAGDDNKLHELCAKVGISLTIMGIDDIGNRIYNQYRSLVKYLGLNIDTNQIMDIDDFIAACDANGMSAPLSTVFQYREKELHEIIDALETNSVVIVTGNAGVGKTRLVLEAIRNFATDQNSRLLCVKNNNLGLYDDLVSATEIRGKYLFFVDDANELAELNQILAYIEKEKLGYDVKIIATVRDYAKVKVIQSVKEHTMPKMIEITPLSDDEIRGFLDTNLQIRNEEYVEQIIRISEGNPRIAYMAGRLAIEKQNLAAIADASQVYDAYYEKFVSNTIGQDETLCFTAGILAVVNAVLMSDLSAVQSILDIYGLSANDFNEKIRELARLEVVEIHLDKVATISDQCLANYMLYYVFFNKRIVSWADVLEAGYKYFRNGVHRATITILEILGSDETKEILKQAVLKVWEIFKSRGDNCFYDFAMDFHIFKPEESFLLVQEKMSTIDEEEINVYQVKFDIANYCPEEKYLVFLGGYQNSPYLDCVVDLLLEYCSKSEKLLISGYKWLEGQYGIDIRSQKYGYYTQKEITRLINDAILGENEIAIAVGIQWASYSLSFSFRPTTISHDNKILLHHLDIKDSVGVTEYREACWNLLTTVAKKPEWQNKILTILDKYANELHEDIDKTIATEDVKHLNTLLKSLDDDSIGYAYVLNKLILCGERAHIKFDNDLKDRFDRTDWKLLQILKDSYRFSNLEYQEYQEQRMSYICDYGRSIEREQVLGFVRSVNDFLEDEIVKRDSYSINQAVEWIVMQFDAEKINAFFDGFVSQGNNISVNPEIVIKPLCKDVNKLYERIKTADFPQKNYWMFSFFEVLPSEAVTVEFVTRFLDFLQDDSDKTVRSAGLRRLRLLDKFTKHEPNIYPMACSIIFAKREYNSYLMQVYFTLLFHEHVYSPQELVMLFRNDLTLLCDIYFYMMKSGGIEDYNGTFLIEFLQLGEMWLSRFSEAFCEHSANGYGHDEFKVFAIWKSDDYISYFDYLFYHSASHDKYKWNTHRVLEAILMCANEDASIRTKQFPWLQHIIIDNLFSDLIEVIFDAVRELDEELRRFAIKIFLENNSDFEWFAKLPLVPNHWSGGDSFVPAYNKQILFLESLYPFVQGSKFLRHRARIKEKVEMLQKMIHQEEVEAIFRHLYM